MILFLYMRNRSSERLVNCPKATQHVNGGGKFELRPLGSPKFLEKEESGQDGTAVKPLEGTRPSLGSWLSFSISG